MKVIQSPEFWTSLAFVVVAFMMIKPGYRFLKKWGQKKADIIIRQQKEAQDILQKAKALETQYKTVFQHRTAERKKALRDAEKEIRFLKDEALGQTEDRIKRKKREVELRLKMIAENGEQDIKRRMLSKLVKQTESLLQEKQEEDTQKIIEKACLALDRYGPALRQ